MGTGHCVCYAPAPKPASSNGPALGRLLEDLRDDYLPEAEVRQLAKSGKKEKGKKGGKKKKGDGAKGGKKKNGYGYGYGAKGGKKGNKIGNKKGGGKKGYGYGYG